MKNFKFFLFLWQSCEQYKHGNNVKKDTIGTDYLPNEFLQQAVKVSSEASIIH